MKSKEKKEIKMTIEDIERMQEELDLKKEKLGIEPGMTEEEKVIMQTISERDKKVRVGFGTMLLGRMLFGKFSDR